MRRYYAPNGENYKGLLYYIREDGENKIAIFTDVERMETFHVLFDYKMDGKDLYSSRLMFASLQDAEEHLEKKFPGGTWRTGVMWNEYKEENNM